MAADLGVPLRHRDLTGDQLHIDKYLSFGTAEPEISAGYVIYIQNLGGTARLWIRESASATWKSVGDFT